MDEFDQIRRCQKGETEAFESLFRANARSVIRTAYLITGDRLLAEEVMQEAFLQLFRLIAQLREPTAFQAWLYRITVRVAQRACAREHHEHAKVSAWLADPTVSGVVSNREAKADDALWEAVQQLPPNQRAAVALHYYQDRPIREIAQIMNAAEGSVKSWLFRAKTAIEKHLSHEGSATHNG